MSFRLDLLFPSDAVWLVGEVRRKLEDAQFLVTDAAPTKRDAGGQLRTMTVKADDEAARGRAVARLLVCPPKMQVEPDILDMVDDIMLWPATFREIDFRIGRRLRRASGADCTDCNAGEQWPDWIVGEAPAFTEALAMACKLAVHDVALTIEGETGSGKELVARLVHYRSARAGKPFVAINCGAMPDSLFESELFGHAAGAYTDARTASEGLVAQANGGTLFLDEVDSLSPHGQVALLRFLQDGRYRAVGSGRDRTSDLRVIAATNTDLERAIADGAFRSDLFYRLAGSRIALPPLRRRRRDILLLADHFVEECRRRFPAARAKHVSADLRGWLLAQPWAGNVRELRSTMENLFILADGDALMPPDAPAGASEGGASFREAKDRAICAFERHELRRILKTHDGNISEAARAVGKERKAFSRLLKKHDIDRSAFLPSDEF